MLFRPYNGGGLFLTLHHAFENFIFHWFEGFTIEVKICIGFFPSARLCFALIVDCDITGGGGGFLTLHQAFENSIFHWFEVFTIEV